MVQRVRDMNPSQNWSDNNSIPIAAHVLLPRSNVVMSQPYGSVSTSVTVRANPSLMLSLPADFRMSNSTIMTGVPNPDNWMGKVSQLVADGTEGPVRSILESEGVHNSAAAILLVFNNYTGMLEGPLIKLTGTIRFDIDPGLVWPRGSKNHILRFRMNMGGLRFPYAGDGRMSSYWTDSAASNLQMSVVDKRTGTVISQGLNTGAVSGVEAGLSIRLHVVPTCPSSADLHISVFPASLDKMKNVASDKVLSLSDLGFPGIEIMKGGTLIRNMTLGLGHDAGTGLGALPILIRPGSTEIQIPEFLQVDREISNLLRQSSLPRLLSKEELETWLSGNAATEGGLAPRELWRPAAPWRRPACIPTSALEAAKKQRDAMARGSLVARPVQVEPPPFTPKVPGIPVLQDYSISDFGDEYWNTWPRNPFKKSVESWINPDSLVEMAKNCGYPKMDWVKQTASDLRTGKRLGFTGAGRIPCEASNLKSAAANGRRTADALADWISKGLVCGPLLPSELPELVRVSPMGAVDKPNGRVRITLDLSWPHEDRDPLSEEIPCSPNASVNKDLYPVRMVNTPAIVRAVWREGLRSLLAKVDWADAYKHFPVHLDDVGLQVMKFGGRYFLDRGLSFGGTTSPSLYDDPAELILDLACHMVGQQRWEAAERMLDDVLPIGQKEKVMELYRTYRELCEHIGVRLASEAEPDKAFAPTKKGVMLGILYDIDAFSWSIAENKAEAIMGLLFQVKEDETVTNSNLEILVGKMNHYMHLFEAKWERQLITACFDPSSQKDKSMVISDGARSQAAYWIRAVSRSLEGNNKIPFPSSVRSTDPILIYADASGVSGGYGCLMEAEGETIYGMGAWRGQLRKRKNWDDNPVSLTFLEALASLAGLLLAPDKVRGRSVRIITDNIGVFIAYSKASSSNLLVYSATKALHDVASALGVNLEISWQQRCSDRGSRAADHLSKRRTVLAAKEMGGLDRMGYESSVLNSYIRNPAVERCLGLAIAQELGTFSETLVWDVEPETSFGNLKRMDQK